MISLCFVSYRCNEIEGKGTLEGDSDDCLPSSSKGSDCTKPNDSVVKLQIKKAEIVIKFGGEGNGSEELPDRTDRQDTSVNIKIDDKEREPIVIDVVKKKPPTENKDPVQIRFDFSNDDESRGEDAYDSNKLLHVYPESESDSGSHSPLLSNKNSSYTENV